MYLTQVGANCSGNSTRFPTKKQEVPKPVGMGSYGMDSRNMQRYNTAGVYVHNEGDIGVSTQGSYSIPVNI